MQLPPEKQVGRTPTQRLNRVRFWLQLWNRVWRRNTIVSRRTVGLAVATCVSWIPSESFKCWWHTHSDCFFRPPFLWLIKRLWLLWFHSFFFFPSKHDWSTIMLVFVRMRSPTGISKERRLCSPCCHCFRFIFSQRSLRINILLSFQPLPEDTTSELIKMLNTRLSHLQLLVQTHREELKEQPQAVQRGRRVAALSFTSKVTYMSPFFVCLCVVTDCKHEQLFKITETQQLCFSLTIYYNNGMVKVAPEHCTVEMMGSRKNGGGWGEDFSLNQKQKEHKTAQNRTNVFSEEEKENGGSFHFVYTTVWGIARFWCICFLRESYIHVIAEQGPGAILQLTLMGSAVQNPRKNRV